MNRSDCFLPGTIVTARGNNLLWRGRLGTEDPLAVGSFTKGDQALVIASVYFELFVMTVDGLFGWSMATFLYTDDDRDDEKEKRW